VFKQYQVDIVESQSKLELFYSLKDSKLLLPLFVYMVLQGANFALGVWKLGGMGLLPTATSDWLAYMEPKEVFSIN
jgi:hypothetical protein